MVVHLDKRSAVLAFRLGEGAAPLRRLSPRTQSLPPLPPTPHGLRPNSTTLPNHPEALEPVLPKKELSLRSKRIGSTDFAMA